MCNRIVKLVYAFVDSRKIIVHESNKYSIISEGLENREYQNNIFMRCDAMYSGR